MIKNGYSININIDLKNCIKVEEFCSVTFGLQTKDKSTYVSETNKGDDWEECYTGRDIQRYLLNNSTLFFENNFEKVKAGGSWNMDIHHSRKIVVRQVGNPEPIFAFDSFGFATLNTMYSIVINNDICSYSYLLAILNSKLIKSYFLSKFSDGKQLFPKIKGYQLKQLPIKNIPLGSQKPFIEKADQMLSLNKELQEVSGKFTRNLEREFSLETLSKKLQSWHQLFYDDFLKELKKQKIELSLSQKADWEDYFQKEKSKAVEIQNQISTTDAEIDKMVYELYGLSEEEIGIVENS